MTESGAPVTGRIRTYIDQLDEKMEGGIPVGNVVLLAGETGTLKSSAAFHLAFENAKRENKSVLYITMEQSRGSLLKNMESLGMDANEVGDRLAIVDVGLLRKNLGNELKLNSWMEIVKMYTQNLKQSHNYEILVLDSLPVLETLSEFKNPRKDLFTFYEWLRDFGVTAILITEVRGGDVTFGNKGEDYLADGIINLMMVKVNEETVQRRLRIVKMRSTNHSTNLFSLIVEGGNFRVARVIST